MLTIHIIIYIIYTIFLFINGLKFIFWFKKIVIIFIMKFWNLFLIDSIKSAEGSCVLKMGKTSVVCGIKAEVAEPRVDDPRKGYIGKKKINNFHLYIYFYL